VEQSVEFPSLISTSNVPKAKNGMETVPSKIGWHNTIGRSTLFERFPQSLFQNVTIGIVDSGLDVSHPEFQDKVADAWDFVEEDAAPQDLFGHGTHVTGILAGANIGLAPNTQLVVARALDEFGKSNSIDLARALFFAHEKGAQIVNCSWGGGAATQALQDAISFLTTSGTLVFTSAGNSNLNLDTYPEPPKNLEGVFVTGAFATSSRKASFSNFGIQSVELFAPGEDIVSTLPGSKWGSKSGTSMSNPMSAATAALLLGLGVQPHRVFDLMCTSATKTALQRVSRCGVLNPLAALQASTTEL
jgi:subtilisin family serine protease